MKVHAELKVSGALALPLLLSSHPNVPVAAISRSQNCRSSIFGSRLVATSDSGNAVLAFHAGRLVVTSGAQRLDASYVHFSEHIKSP